MDNDKFHAEGFQGSKKKLDEIREGVNHLFNRTVGKLFIDRHGEETGGKLIADTRRYTERYLSGAPTTGALLRENYTGDIIGMTFAFPSYYTPNFHMYSEEFTANNLSFSEHADTLEKTAEVGWTVILEEHRGQGGWTLMMNSLELGLVSRKGIYGREYDYHTRFVRKDNGYAEKIRQRYGEHIVYESSYNNPSFLGEQAYFRIKLDK